MLTFPTVAREIRALVARRREILTLLGSLFAALGIFLENVLEGSLPPSLRALEGRVFATYAFLLAIPALILALRLARLNAGMVLNGILYSRLLLEQTFTPPADPGRAARLNPAGVSFLMFLLADLIAGFAIVLLALVLGASAVLASLAGLVVSGIWLAIYVLFHRRAVIWAKNRIATATFTPPSREDWMGHVSGSLEDANHDMTAVLALVGLIVFSAFQSLSGLGGAVAPTDLPPEALRDNGPAVYGLLMTVTCLAGMATYIRLRVAVGRFSLQLDPEDRPFRPLRLTDSLLGYVLLAFLFAVSLHVLLFPRFGSGRLMLATILAFLAAVAIEPIAVFLAARRR